MVEVVARERESGEAGSIKGGEGGAFTGIGEVIYGSTGWRGGYGWETLQMSKGLEATGAVR